MSVAHAVPEAPDVLTEEPGVTAPPAKLTLPKLRAAAEPGKPPNWSSGLTDLASKVAGIKPAEPPPQPPAPAPVIHSRPRLGFD